MASAFSRRRCLGRNSCSSGGENGTAASGGLTINFPETVVNDGVSTDTVIVYDLTNAAYFSDASAWPAIGYTGPREV